MFIENVGQFDERARFQVRGDNGTIWLTEDALWIAVLERQQANDPDPTRPDRLARIANPKSEVENPQGVNLHISFVGANMHPHLEPFNRLDTPVSFFIGNDPAQWRPAVPVWGGIRYKDLYPGIDLEIAGENGQMVQRVLARPGANLTAVRLRVEGAGRLALDGDRLRLTTALGELTLPLLQVAGVSPAGIGLIDDSPSAGPTIIGDQVAVPFAGSAGTATSTLSAQQQRVATNGESDLLYSTFLGGSNYDVAEAITVDASGAAYVIGRTRSSGFPTIPGAYRTTRPGGLDDIFVTKLSADGTGLVYSTFLGGSDIDYGEGGIAVDANGAAYVAGRTWSADFPTTPGAYDRTLGERTDAYVAKLNADGSALLYSTLLGGSLSGELIKDIALDTGGSAYVIGATSSSDFPATGGAFQTAYGGGPTDAFVAKVTADGSGLVYATYLGGSDFENDNSRYGIAVDSGGSAYVTSNTRSTDFPTTPGAFQTTFQAVSGSNTYVTKLNANGSGLAYSTYLGGSYAEGHDIAVDSSGAAYVAGEARANFPTTPGAFQPTWNGGTDAFVTKLNPDGSGLIYSTYVGGLVTEWAAGIALDADGGVAITGSTYSSNFPTTPGAFDVTFSGSSDAFVTRLSADGSGLRYSTYLSYGGGDGIATDGNGAAYITGGTSSSNFPTTPTAFDTTYNGSTDAFVTKLNVAGSVPYDCTAALDSLSYIGEAVLDEVGPQNFCLNRYEGLIILPPGLDAFERFAELARNATYEVDFVTMSWSRNSPGIIFLQGVKDLYERIRQNPVNHPVRVKILLGLQYYGRTGGIDQRVYVLEILNRLNVPCQARFADNLEISCQSGSGTQQEDLDWMVEVATYRDSQDYIPEVPILGRTPFYPLGGTHSHAKMMIVDGKTVIAAGYNMESSYLEAQPMHDLGIQVSGPIAQNTLEVFDGLWERARSCTSYNETTSTCSSGYNALRPIHEPEVQTVFVPDDNGRPVNVFSLFRDDLDKTADNAITAAIRSSIGHINILQNRFFEDYPGTTRPIPVPYCPSCPPTPITIPSCPLSEDCGPFSYSEALVYAITKKDATGNYSGATVSLLLSGGGDSSNLLYFISDHEINRRGYLNLVRQIEDIDPQAVVRLRARFYGGTPDFPNLHTKALSIDRRFLIVGSQNFDYSAFDDSDGEGLSDLDLAEYSLGVDDPLATAAFNGYFEGLWYYSTPVEVASSSLQASIERAPRGAILLVPPGTYPETLTIDKPLTLLGLSADQTFVGGASTSTSGPAVIRVTSSDVTIMHLTVRDGTGYGIELIDQSPSSLENVSISRIVFENNTLGGVLVQGLIPGSPLSYTLENNTFIGGASGVTVNVSETQALTSTVRNNIFAGQIEAPIQVLSAHDGGVDYGYNLFFECGTTEDCAANWHTGDLSSESSAHDNVFDRDPLFVDPAAGDYHLSPGSPAIDAGDPDSWNPEVFDGDGDGTPQIDLGAFEAYFIQPRLIIIKHVVNDNGGTATAADFMMNVSGTNVDPVSFTGDENGTTVFLDAGSYSVSESGPNGYAMSLSADCTGTITLGETKTCTVTNDDIPPKLVVIKHVINDNGGAAVSGDFTISVTGTNVNPSSFPGDENGTTVTLDSGGYNVRESGPSIYAVSLSGDCSGTIALGETKICTVINDDIQPKLVVIKHVVNDNGGTATAADFTMSVSGTNVSPASFPGDENGTTVTLNEGNYEVSEIVPYGYAVSFSSDCTGIIAFGETKICTVTNDDFQIVDIDIIPHSKRNRIHFHRKQGPIGLIQVAILSTSNFNAPSLVNRTSLTFGHTGYEESLRSCFDNARDVNHDGLRDLVCVFQSRLTGFRPGDTEGILKGKTVDGMRIEGSDSVQIVIIGEHDEEERRRYADELARRK